MTQCAMLMRVQAQARRHPAASSASKQLRISFLPNTTWSTTYKHSTCASPPSLHSCAPSTPSPTPPAPSSAQVPQTPSGAPFTATPNVRLYIDLCQTFLSWVRFSDHLAAWRITQTTHYRRLRANGRRNCRLVRSFSQFRRHIITDISQSSSASSARRAPKCPAPAPTISTTPTPACTRALAVTRLSTRQTTSLTQDADGQPSGMPYQALLDRRQILVLA